VKGALTRYRIIAWVVGVLLLALTLYIMRRRVRQGRRTPKF